MSIANYLTALDAQRDQLARNLVTMGVQASESEKMNTLVPKVLQIPTSQPETTLFHSGSDALQTYGELLYTYYVDGYRSLSGFADIYPNFCCAENDYAIYYNQPDFNWGATIYTMCITPVRITPAKKILLCYNSGSTDIGEMWLGRKAATELSPAETARYIHEKVSGGEAISIPFGWLGSVGNFITVLHDCGSVSADEYYLAWKAVTDNTSPMIRTVKVLEVTT